MTKKYDRFERDGKSRYIDKVTGKSISRHQRDKILRIGRYKPNSQQFKKVAGTTSRFIDVVTGQEISRYQRDKLLKVGDHRPETDKDKYSRIKLKKVRVLSKKQIEEKERLIVKRLKMSLPPVGGYSFKGRPLTREKIAKLFTKFIQYSYAGNIDNLKELSKIFGIKFESVEEYQKFIKMIMEWLDYSTPEWAGYN